MNTSRPLVSGIFHEDRDCNPGHDVEDIAALSPRDVTTLAGMPLQVLGPPGSDHDIVLLRGIEPNMRWRAFCDEIVEIAAQLGVVEGAGQLVGDELEVADLPQRRCDRADERPQQVDDGGATVTAQIHGLFAGDAPDPSAVRAAVEALRP